MNRGICLDKVLGSSRTLEFAYLSCACKTSAWSRCAEGLGRCSQLSRLFLLPWPGTDPGSCSSAVCLRRMQSCAKTPQIFLTGFLCGSFETSVPFHVSAFVLNLTSLRLQWHWVALRGFVLRNARLETARRARSGSLSCGAQTACSVLH